MAKDLINFHKHFYVNCSMHILYQNVSRRLPSQNLKTDWLTIKIPACRRSRPATSQVPPCPRIYTIGQSATCLVFESLDSRLGWNTWNSANKIPRHSMLASMKQRRWSRKDISTPPPSKKERHPQTSATSCHHVSPRWRQAVVRYLLSWVGGKVRRTLVCGLKNILRRY